MEAIPGQDATTLLARLLNNLNRVAAVNPLRQPLDSVGIIAYDGGIAR